MEIEKLTRNELYLQYQFAKTDLNFEGLLIDFVKKYPEFTVKYIETIDVIF